MPISYHTEGCEFTFKGKEKTRAWINTVASIEGWRTGSISVVFCSDDVLLKINREYLQHNYFTDIITFDYSDPMRKVISGDLMISIDTVRKNSLEFGVSFDNELHRVVIHGILHLLGYGDKSPKEEKKMHKLEDKYLLQK